MVVSSSPLAATQIFDPLLGRDIGGRFVLTERLGGEAGRVTYRAVQRSVGRDVSVQILQPTAHLGEVACFLAQARTLSVISHPNVMKVIDAGLTGDGLVFVVSGLLDERTLADAIADEGPFDLDRLTRIAIQLCDALDAAHSRSIAHRALGPASVLLLPGDSIVLRDFALASAQTERGAADRRSDLYALGLILHQLAVGRPPDAESPPLALAHLPRPLAALILALLSPDRARRPPSARQVRAELVAMSSRAARRESPRLAGGTGPGVPHLPPPSPPPRWRRLPASLQMAAGAGLGLGLGYALAVLAVKAFGLV